MERYTIEPYRDFVRPYYAGMGPVHGMAHIDRIIGRLELFSRGITPEPRQDLLFFLAAFHGLDRLLKDNRGFAQNIRSFLIGLNWTDEEIDEAFTALLRHLENPKSVEEAIVHDANYVEIVGAFGIAKAFSTGGRRGMTYEETAEHFERKYLNRVEFRTPMGIRLGREKSGYTREFLRRLRREL